MAVYFIRNENTGRIKIGFTGGNPKARRSALQTSHDGQLTIIKVIAGDRMRETEIQAMFKHLHIRGEWHEPGADLLKFIETQYSIDFANMEHEPRHRPRGRKDFSENELLLMEEIDKGRFSYRPELYKHMRWVHGWSETDARIVFNRLQNDGYECLIYEGHGPFLGGISLSPAGEEVLGLSNRQESVERYDGSYVAESDTPE